MIIEQIEQDLHYLDENIKAVDNEWKINEISVKRFSLFKRLVRKLTYWLYKPMWDQQIRFNQSITAAICDIYRIQSQLLKSLDNGVLLSENVCANLDSNGKPRIIQLVSSLNYGDAVGNEVIAFKKFFQEKGFVSEIYAETIHKRVPANVARYFKYMPEFDDNDIVIYHFSSQCGMFEMVKKLKCKVILRYHNITPPHFFHDYDRNSEKATSIGLHQAAQLKDYVDYCFPVSEFNKQDLIDIGYTCPMRVVPILIRFSDYEQQPSSKVIEKYSDGQTNILFVGRMAPNKKVEDVISCFAEYKNTYNENARLFLVGSFNDDDKYYQMLCKHIKNIGVKDVIFPGHIMFDEILAYYKIADVFLCMSEHEGFCVPLVEAMYFHVPIVAYASTAIPSTLNGSGVLLDYKDAKIASKIINRIVNDMAFAKDIISLQDKRLRDFNNELLIGEIMEPIKYLIAEESSHG